MQTSTQKNDFLNASDFDDFDTSESITMYDGITITEGSDYDRTEFFSVSVLGDLMIE